MAQTSLNPTGVASSGALSLQSNGTTEAIGISTGQVATLAQNPILTSGTVNGLAFLNASKVLTTGSALTFDGTNLVLGTGGSSGGFAFTQRVAASASPVNAYRITNGSDTTLDVTLQTSLTSIGNGIGSLAFLQAGTEGMRLTSTGLGIGTSSPSYKLDVYGSGTPVAAVRSSATGDAKLYLECAGTNSGYVAYNRSLQSLTFSANNSTNHAILDSAGNLGLGVTPSAWALFTGNLELNNGNTFSGNASQNNLTQNAYYGSGGWTYKTSTYASRYQQISGAHVWHVAPSGTAGNAITFTQAMTLDASGNLLVGKTTPSFTTAGAELRSGGISAFIRDSSSATVYIVKPTATFTTGNMVEFRYNDATTVGTISYTSTSVAYNTTSDYRLKTVISAVTGAGERIDALEPVEYEWKSDGSRTRGFLAHKFQEVYAGSVTGSKDAVDEEGKPAYQAMQAGSPEVIADLVAEIQSLRKRLAAAGI